MAHRAPSLLWIAAAKDAATGLPAGNADLIAAFGGNSEVAAFYDRRTGVTVTGAGASEHADCRGPGFGPSLLQATDAARPGYNPGTKVLTYGAGKSMKTALSSVFDLAVLGSATTILIGQLLEGAIDSQAGITDETGVGGRNLALGGTSAGPTIWRADFGGPVGGLGQAGAPADGAVHLAMASISDSNFCRIHCPNIAHTEVPGGTMPSGNNLFRVLGSGIGRFDAALVVRHGPLSAPELTALSAYATGQHSAVLY